MGELHIRVFMEANIKKQIKTVLEPYVDMVCGPCTSGYRFLNCKCLHARQYRAASSRAPAVRETLL